jgi:metal-dependent amidase/aminoacylase/carboxypeptidase family protein
VNAVKTSSADPVLEHLDRLLPNLEALYTDVHAHPELSMQETRTPAWQRTDSAAPATR